MTATKKNTPASVKIWMFFALLAIGPFLLRTGLDLESISRQGVFEIYQRMRFQSVLKDWPNGSPVVFERQHEKSAVEDAFKSNLQRDFKLVEIGEAPRVRVFFDSDTFLNAQVDIEMPSQKGQWQPWQGSVRLVNNGILFGFWVGILLFLLNRKMSWAVFSAIGITAFWQADWNILEIPGTYFQIFSSFSTEMIHRWREGNWATNELGRLLELAALIGFLMSLLIMMARRLSSKVESMKVIFFASMLLEPVVFYFTTRAANWGLEVSWWKIYFGSFVFRYLLFGHVFFYFVKKDYLNWETSRWIQGSHAWKVKMALMALPLIFVFSGGWTWVLSVFSLGTSSALLRLKIFFASFVLSFFLGSRMMSMLVANLAFAVIFPPTEGHWATSVAWAFMMDGVLLGWFLSPFKGFDRSLMVESPRSRFFIVTAIAWVLGIFMTSVGAPSSITWATVVVVLWGYSELIRSQNVKNSQAGALLNESE